MFRHALIATSLSVAVCGGFVSTARADNAADTSYQEGLRQFDSGNFDAAAQNFEKAYVRTPTAKHLWNWTLSEIKLERSLDAIKHLKEYRALSDANPANVAKIDGLLEKEHAKLTRLRIDAPVGASIEIDGVFVGTAPIDEPIEADPKTSHRVTMKRGEVALAQEVAPAGAKLVTVQFEASAPIQRPLSSPAAVAPTLAPAPVENGSHTTRNIVVATATGLAVVALGVGVYFRVRSGELYDRAVELRARSRDEQPNAGPNSSCAGVSSATCLSLSQTVQDGLSASNASTTFLITGGLLAASAVAVFFLWPSAGKNTRGWIVPRVNTVGAGIDIGGRF
jgi:tetratricopeptide (TPR) repeat protein